MPSERSLRRKLNALGFKPRRVAKSKPLRKIAQTDAIFVVVHRINAKAVADAGSVRISIDTKTVMPIGNLSRGGKSRQAHQALDHDLEPEAKVTPFGVRITKKPMGFGRQKNSALSAESSASYS